MCFSVGKYAFFPGSRSCADFNPADHSICGQVRCLWGLNDDAMSDFSFFVSFTRIWSKSESDWNVMTGFEINIQYIVSNIYHSFRIIKDD